MDIGRQIHTVSHAPPLAAVSPEEPHWFATQTRARHEKMVVTQLEKKGVTGFLPLVTEVHQWSDRRKVIHQPTSVRLRILENVQNHRNKK